MNGIQHDMVGESLPVEQLLRVIAKVAPTRCNVLITGESGTGKEHVAKALHRNSKRSAGPFVAVNGTAMPESLLESELFGHERGAFTGAVRDKAGKFEQAAGGTLFLDEVGDMPLAFQPKLLRALQERVIERIGGFRSITVDFRLIAATNRDLQSAIAAGEFRQDLYYRLAGVSIQTPALRDRLEDIPILVSFFLSRFSQDAGRAVKGISSELAELFQHYDWPGNIRELQNLILYGIVLGSDSVLLPEDMPAGFIEAVRHSRPCAYDGYRQLTRRLKRTAVAKALNRAHGDCKTAAALLGVPANGMHRMVKELGLNHLLKNGAHDHES
jgi:DNA-binding NtrC family response regulator